MLILQYLGRLVVNNITSIKNKLLTSGNIVWDFIKYNECLENARINFDDSIEILVDFEIKIYFMLKHEIYES